MLVHAKFLGIELNALYILCVTVGSAIGLITLVSYYKGFKIKHKYLRVLNPIIKSLSVLCILSLLYFLIYPRQEVSSYNFIRSESEVYAFKVSDARFFTYNDSLYKLDKLCKKCDNTPMIESVTYKPLINIPVINDIINSIRVNTETEYVLHGDFKVVNLYDIAK